jgi:K+/H+ antiporter YhaU regulatory subunit KhtT
MSLAQIGEFSFIIATLGMSLGVTTEVLYQLAVIVALITSFTTPYLIKASESAGTTIENALPKFLKSRFDDYQQLLIKIASVFNDPRLGGTVTRIKSVLNVAIKGDDSRFNRLSPWGVSLKSISISEHSPAAGRSIRELALRSNTGATIVVIERGGKATTSPKADMRLFPGDELLVLGTDSQLMALGNIVDTPREQATHADDTSDFSLGSALVESRSLLVHKSIRELGLREQFNSLVVGIERNGSRIVNPESDQIIEADDVLWVVGPASALENIRKIAKMGDHNAPPTTAQRAENLPQTMA